MPVILAPDLYTNPPKTAIGGSRWDHRSMALLSSQVANTNLFALGVLPAGHELVDCYLESDDLDSNGSPTLTMDVGLLNSNYNAPVDGSPALQGGKNILTASTVGQAGGRVSPVLAFTKAIGVDYVNDRIIAVKPNTNPATAQAGSIGIIFCVEQK